MLFNNVLFDFIGMNKFRIINVVFLFQCIGLMWGYESYAQFSFKHAPIGGGGFVTGIINHPTSGDIWCRTDVGGAYRWDAGTNEWIQLLDWVNDSEGGFYGVEALALDPQNANNVYMLCGTSYMNGGRTAIIKSTDKGNTFTYTDVTSKFKAHGNGNGRGNGERLAVDPNNSNILFCGTRANGLWKSTDAGVTWNLAWNGVTTTPNENGICFVLFDPLSNVVSGATQTIYIGISRTGSANIYKSTDGGSTFTAISANTAFYPHRPALQGTTMYVTHSDDQGPGSSGFGKVYKLNTSTGVWTNVTPVHWQDYPYGGVCIDPSNVNRVVISTSGIYWNNQYGTTWGDFVFFSSDGGTTWTLKNGTNATFNKNGIGHASGQVNWGDCVMFDPSNPLKVRVIGGGGIFTTSDISATNPVWYPDVVGIEETALLDAVSLPSGRFLCALGDMDGFLYDDLTVVPTQNHQPSVGTNRSIDYAALNPSRLVRTSDAGSSVYYSNDAGSTWTASATVAGTGGRAAISADGNTILHCPGGSYTTYYSTNNGGSWSPCAGSTLSGNWWAADAIPVADQANTNYFYLYDRDKGTILASSNKGVSFSVAGTPGYTSAPWNDVFIRTVPGKAGHIWVPLVNNGLKYSTDFGATYTTVSNVSYALSVGIGIAEPCGSYPTIFMWGTVSGVTGLFRSIDQGATWTRMNDDAHEFGGLPLLIGDMKTPGRVFSGGGGVIYWDETNPCMALPLTSLHFSASLDAQGYPELFWLTNQESDVQYFTVEKSFNGSDFQTLCTMNASANVDNGYSFRDTTRFSGTIFYRIKMTDVNGQVIYTEAKRLTTNEAAVSLYPNPATQEIMFAGIAVSDAVKISVHELTGREVSAVHGPFINSITISVSQLPAGLYFAIIKTEDRQEIYSFVKE